MILISVHVTCDHTHPHTHTHTHTHAHTHARTHTHTHTHTHTRTHAPPPPPPPPTHTQAFYTPSFSPDTPSSIVESCAPQNISLLNAEQCLFYRYDRQKWIKYIWAIGLLAAGQSSTMTVRSCAVSLLSAPIIPHWKTSDYNSPRLRCFFCSLHSSSLEGVMKLKFVSFHSS